MFQNPSPYVTPIPFVLFLLCAMWISRRLNFGRQFVSALLIALVSFQLLFFSQGYVGAPFGILDINVLSPEKDVRVAATQHERIASFLRSLLLFAAWNDEQIGKLAGASFLKSYTTNELLVRQGDEGGSLLFIYAGRAGVFVERESDRVRVATRAAGEFFGEMSPLTGEVRSATVIAEGEMDVVVIDKEHFVSVLMKDPTILEMLLDAFDERRAATAEQIAAAEAQDQDALSARANLMRRIVRFLGISV